MERSKKTRGKDEKAHSETDRYKHDMQQALAMRAGLGKRREVSGIQNSSQNYLLQDDGVSLGLLALDEADGLRKNKQYESAFDLYQRGIELLIKYLRDTNLNGPVDHITLQARVAEALSNAEALKEIIRRNQQKPLTTQRQPNAHVDLKAA